MGRRREGEGRVKKGKVEKEKEGRESKEVGR